MTDASPRLASPQPPPSSFAVFFSSDSSSFPRLRVLVGFFTAGFEPERFNVHFHRDWVVREGGEEEGDDGKQLVKLLPPVFKCVYLLWMEER